MWLLPVSCLAARAYPSNVTVLFTVAAGARWLLPSPRAALLWRSLPFPPPLHDRTPRPDHPARTGPFPQSRARHPRVPAARDRGGRGSGGADPRAAAVPVHRLVEPRRVLRDPRGRSPGADPAERPRQRAG